MDLLSRETLTIASTITPPGLGGVSVIRVSGKQALNNVRKIASFLPESPESHRIYYGYLKDTKGEEKLDEVLISYFAEGKSFTGEESLEISHHGNPTLSKMILKELQACDISLAQPGEFTFRAFINQRIDLVQAEAVLDLIEAKSSRAAKVALKQLEGGFSKQLEECEQELLGVMAHLEANLDFAQEDIVIESSQSLAARLSEILNVVDNLLSKAEVSKSLRESFDIALVGEPNVGKSSLLNALCEKDLAIVSEQAGTTRDIVFGEMFLNGHIIHFFDTAGLRDTEDAIENLGIARAKDKMENSDLVFHLVDAQKALKDMPAPKGHLLINKCDELSKAEYSQLDEKYPSALLVSAKTGLNLESIRAHISARLENLSLDETPVILQARHLEAFSSMKTALEKGIELLKEDSSSEFVISEIQEALMRLFEVRGKRFDDEILDRVFKEFCLGK